MSRFSSARPIVFVVASALALFVVGPGSIATAEAASPVYSDPDWWPVHMATKVDCTHSNKCPTGPHKQWGIDVIPLEAATDTEYGPGDYGIYAMGAGIAHIGNAHGTACGTGKATDFGTWVWVDHSAGVVSKYGHLSKIDIKDGQQVQVGTKLGVMGNTGDSSTRHCSRYPYLDFQVRHEGITGPSVPFATTDAPTRDGDLLVCTTSGPARLAEHEQARPDNAYGRSLPDDSNTYHSIDAMGPEWFLIGGTSGCAGAAKYRKGPSKVTLHASGSKLKATWSKAPSGVNAVRVELDRRTASGWQPANAARWTDLTGGKTTTTQGSLHAGSEYRSRVWFHTTTGWSTPSAWVTAHAP